MMSASNLYFKTLLNYISAVENLNVAQKNEFWIGKYQELGMEIKSENTQCLPQIIPLIHPEFLIDNGGEDIGKFISHERSNFGESINSSDLCQINLIDKDLFCEFNNYRNLRKKCHADHHWPFSLGGPTILENRVLLCRFHNIAKSNSIINQFWNSYPIWLNGYINRIYNLKR